MTDMLSLSAGLPEVELATGEVVLEEGGAAGSIWILVSGALEVRKGDVVVHTIRHPGSTVGEMSLLLGSDYTATVVAAEPSRVRHAAAGRDLLTSDPSITHHVAVGLAERLRLLTTYLADLTHQYGDAPGLQMVSDVLLRLERHDGPRAVPGSMREPDPEY